ncbi:MAG: siderophore biosynthesis protein PvsA, partial [Pseudomonas sp.]
MQRPFVILAHVAHPAILEGFLPAAHKRGLPIVVITDHAQEHRRLLATSHISPDELHVIECDVFNPLAVVETLNSQGLRPAAV